MIVFDVSEKLSDTIILHNSLDVGLETQMFLQQASDFPVHCFTYRAKTGEENKT